MVRRIKPLHQVTQTECGLVACVMLMKALGSPITLREAREKYEVGRDGLTIRQIRDLLTNQGLAPRVLKVPDSAIFDIPTPAIAYWKKSHFVMVESVGSSFTILDPAVGRRKLSATDFSSGFSGILIVGSPPFIREKAKAEPSPWLSILPVARANRGRIAMLMLLAMATVVTTLASPLAVSGAVSSLMENQSTPSMMALVLFLGVMATLLLINVINVLIAVSAAVAIGRDLAAKVFSSLLDLPFKYFALRNRGEILYRIHATNQIESFLTDEVARSVGSALTVTAAAIGLLWLSPPIGCLAILVFSGMWLLLVVARRKTTQWADAEMHFESLANAVQVDSITAVSLIKTGGLKESTFHEWINPFDNGVRWRKKREFLEGLVQTAATFVQTLSPLVFTVAALSGTIGQSMNLGGALGLQMLSGVFFSQLTVISQLAARWGTAISSARRIDDILSHSKDKILYWNKPIELSGRVKLQNVDFAYTNLSPLAITGINFEIKPGEHVAFVGPSGSGKSSLAKLIVGLYSPTHGQILFNGMPLRYHEEASFRAQVAYVEQDSQLLNATIWDNIALGRSNVSFNDVRDAAMKASINDDIEGMPMGYDTFLTNGGDNISGGQRQRIALARALFGDPKVLVLDEATSGLDRASEQRVLKSLEGMCQTRITIAHRLDTIRSADRIFVMDKGKIIASGDHNMLLRECELYAELYKEQGY